MTLYCLRRRVARLRFAVSVSFIIVLHKHNKSRAFLENFYYIQSQIRPKCVVDFPIVFYGYVRCESTFLLLLLFWLFWCMIVAFTLIHRNTQHREGCDAKVFWGPHQLTSHGPQIPEQLLEVSGALMNSLQKHGHHFPPQSPLSD